jgi:hypothetical protein
MQGSTATAPAAARGAFIEALLHFINEELPRLHEPLRGVRPDADAQTPLFESGLIDSLAILHLLGCVERLTGRPVPPRLVVMKHFRTVAAICEAFGPRQEESSA